MESNGKNRNKKGRNKRSKKIILPISCNYGDPLCPESKSVQTEDRANKNSTAENQQAVKSAARSEDREKSPEKEIPQLVNPWKLVTRCTISYLISTYFIDTWDIVIVVLYFYKYIVLHYLIYLIFILLYNILLHFCYLLFAQFVRSRCNFHFTAAVQFCMWQINILDLES